MNISAIGPNFNGKRDNIDAVISLDDNSIRQLAYLQTASKVDPKKDRNVTNALFYSAPLAAGLATAVLGDGSATKIFSKKVTGVAARAAKGLKIAGLWTAALAAIDLLGFGKRKLSENSAEVRKFDRNHPLISMGAMIGAGFGVLALVNKAGMKLGTKNAPKFMQKFAKSAAEFLNNNKYMVKAKDGLLKLADKMPHSLKQIGATALDWAPTGLLIGGLFHSVASRNRVNREFTNNYNDLKERQTSLARARVRELSLENDFLMQDARNKEDMKIMNDNLADLPEEVVEKVQELQDVEA